jgi:hypothetical protein
VFGGRTAVWSTRDKEADSHVHHLEGARRRKERQRLTDAIAQAAGGGGAR